MVSPFNNSLYRVGSSMFSTKESQFSEFGILRFFTAFAKKLFGSFATCSQFVNKELFSVSFILSEKWILFDKKGLTVF